MTPAWPESLQSLKLCSTENNFLIRHAKCGQETQFKALKDTLSLVHTCEFAQCNVGMKH